MAEGSVKNLEKELKRCICQDIYFKPKLLKCSHVYCEECLRKCVQKYVPENQQGQLVISCPQCRQVTPVPESGVAGLQSAFVIEAVLEIHKSLQAPADPTKKVGYCFVHRCELDLYCETCRKLICNECALFGNHRDHDYSKLNQAFEKYQRDIIPLLDPLREQVKTFEKALAEFNLRSKEILNQQTVIKGNIHATFNHLQEILETRKTELIRQLDKMTELKLKNLADQKYQIETRLAQLVSCLQFVTKSLKTGDEEDALMMKANTEEQVGELTTPFQQAFLMPCAKADTVFSASADIIALCQNYGQVCTDTPGSTDLYSMAEGQYVNGSPVEKLGAPLRSIDQVRTPRGVAINQKGEVVVTEVDSCCVSVFSPNGNKLHSFGTLGSDQGQFSKLRGVALDGEGNILVADSGNHRIQKFTAEGQFLAAVGTKGQGELEFSFPTGIAVSNSMIYVAEWDNHRVQVLNSDLSFFSTFGKQGKCVGEFDRPWGIAFDSTGNVYVADSYNGHIQVFTAEGVYLRMFGRLGEPLGIAIDANDQVYVSEGMTRCISVFTSEGQFVTSCGREGEGPGEFRYPNGLAVNKCGVVYVCDVSSHKVQLLCNDNTLFARL